MQMKMQTLGPGRPSLTSHNRIESIEFTSFSIAAVWLTWHWFESGQSKRESNGGRGSWVCQGTYTDLAYNWHFVVHLDDACVTLVLMAWWFVCLPRWSWMMMSVNSSCAWFDRRSLSLYLPGGHVDLSFERKPTILRIVRVDWHQCVKGCQERERWREDRIQFSIVSLFMLLMMLRHIECLVDV